jgi:WD40 repeat protein
VRELPSLKALYKIRPHDELDEPDFMISPDAKWLLSWGPDHFLKLYDTATGKLAQNSSAGAKVSKVIMSPDSTACYVFFDNSAFLTEGYWDYYVMKMALPELKIIGSARIQEFLSSPNLSPDGRRLVILQGASEKEVVTIFDTASMKPIGAVKE